MPSRIVQVICAVAIVAFTAASWFWIRSAAMDMHHASEELRNAGRAYRLLLKQRQPVAADGENIRKILKAVAPDEIPAKPEDMPTHRVTKKNTVDDED